MKKKAVTLIELIVTMVLVGFFIAGMSWYINNIMDIWQRVSFDTEVGNDARAAMLHMGRYLRQIKADGIEQALSNTITFLMVDANDNEIRIEYQYDTSHEQILYKRDTDLDTNWNSTNVLLEGVSSFDFDYRALDGTQTAVVADIKFIDIALTVSGNQGSESIELRIYPRNFID